MRQRAAGFFADCSLRLHAPNQQQRGHARAGDFTLRVRGDIRKITARIVVQVRLGKTPYRSRARVSLMLGAVMTMPAMHNELRDLHAARFAEMAALREMLAVHGPTGHGQLDAALADRMRDSVAEILRLQRIISLIQE